MMWGMDLVLSMVTNADALDARSDKTRKATIVFMVTIYHMPLLCIRRER